MASPLIIQTGSKFDFVHLNGKTDGVNQAFKEDREILTIWSFWFTIEKSPMVSDVIQSVAPLGL